MQRAIDDYQRVSGESVSVTVTADIGGTGYALNTNLVRKRENGDTARGLCVTAQDAAGPEADGRPALVRVLASDGGVIVSMRDDTCTVVVK